MSTTVGNDGLVSSVLLDDIDELADQLCRAVDGAFDFVVVSGSNDKRIQKLAMLINSVVDPAGRAIEQVRRTNEELRAKEARYRELFANMSDGVAIYEAVWEGRDFVFTDVNNACLTIERLRREEVVGRRVTEVFPRIEEFGLLDVLRRVYSTGMPEHMSARLYQDHRISGWRENFVYRLPTNEVVAVYRDVSAQKAAETALRSTLEETQQIIDAAPCALVIVGKDQTIRRANGVAGAILGLKPGELVGQSWSRFAPDASTGVSGQAAEESIVVGAKGGSICVLLSVLPATIAGEEVLIEAFLDLSERNRLETELRHAQKLEAVGQLAAGIAHEINTPAQFLGDNIVFLRQAWLPMQRVGELGKRIAEASAGGSVPPDLLAELQTVLAELDLDYVIGEVPRALSESAEGIQRVSSIVRSLKEFAQPEPAEKRPVDLRRMIDNAITITRNAWKHVAQVDTEFDPDLPLVSCVPGEMNQVFLNILMNAIHAVADKVGADSSSKGSIHVAARCDGAWVEVRVRDTGTGIPEAIRPRIFDPFFTTKEVGRGIGQGLAIAHGVVVKKHAGTLAFESQVGQGTTFVVRLPLAS